MQTSHSSIEIFSLHFSFFSFLLSVKWHFWRDHDFTNDACSRNMGKRRKTKIIDNLMMVGNVSRIVQHFKRELPSLSISPFEIQIDRYLYTSHETRPLVNFEWITKEKNGMWMDVYMHFQQEWNGKREYFFWGREQKEKTLSLVVSSLSSLCVEVVVFLSFSPVKWSGS